MKKLFFYLPVLVLILFLVKGCNYENPVNTSDSRSTDDPNLWPIISFQTDLITSSNSSVGIMKIWFDKNNMNIYFGSITANTLKNIHLEVATSMSQIPMDGYCPSYESFNHIMHNLPANTKSYTYAIPLNIFPSDVNTFYYSAEVEFETSLIEPNCNVAWAQGIDFRKCSSFSKFLILYIGSAK